MMRLAILVSSRPVFETQKRGSEEAMKGNIKGKPGFLKGNNKRFLCPALSPVKVTL
jgi:hypothetical protein